MQIEAFLLCDAATDANGKLNVLGAFDTILAREIPTVHPFCSIAARLRYAREETGKHGIQLRLFDSDGLDAVPPMRGDIEIGFVGDDPSTAINIVWNIQGLQLARWGVYSLRLELDGQEAASLPLYVKPSPPAIRPS